MYPISPETEELIAALPKAELHIHLEGSVQPATLLTLAQRNNVDLGISDEAGLRELYRFRDFLHFLNLFGDITTVLRKPEDFQLITEELGQQAAQQNVRYLEVTCSIATHCIRKDLPFNEVMDALATGAARVKQISGVEMRFIFDHVRNFPVEECQQVAEWCIQGRKRGVVALGLGGLETGNPASRFAEIIRWVQSQGVTFIPHAGEAVGPEGIWDALQFNPPRLGHGIRAAEDPALVAYLRENGVVLEVCPTSNICTGCTPAWDDHPLRTLWDADVPLTINSDDPPLFNTTLLDEYRVAVTRFNFTPSDFARANLTAIRASLLPLEERQRLEAQFQSEYQQLGI